ncbi:MAG TPA: hypothetical protein VGG46_13925 [Terriglobales bacterium]
MEEVKFSTLLLSLIVLVQVVHAQENKPWGVDRLCGRLEHVEKIPDRKDANTYSENRKALRGLSVSLFERHEDDTCCESLTAIASVTTDKHGQFEFKNENPGQYWLATKWNGKEYRTAVTFQPTKNSQTSCSEQGIGINQEGQADWWVSITVD